MRLSNYQTRAAYDRAIGHALETAEDIAYQARMRALRAENMRRAAAAS